MGLGEIVTAGLDGKVRVDAFVCMKVGRWYTHFPAHGKFRPPGSRIGSPWTFCPQNGLFDTSMLTKSPSSRHWSQLCNILRRSDEEPGRKAT